MKSAQPSSCFSCFQPCSERQATCGEHGALLAYQDGAICDRGTRGAA